MTQTQTELPEPEGMIMSGYGCYCLLSYLIESNVRIALPFHYSLHALVYEAMIGWSVRKALHMVPPQQWLKLRSNAENKHLSHPVLKGKLFTGSTNKQWMFLLSGSRLYVYGLLKSPSAHAQLPMQQMKGYSSNQSVLWTVVTLPVAEPVTLRFLHICEHACENAHSSSLSPQKLTSKMKKGKTNPKANPNPKIK